MVRDVRISRGRTQQELAHLAGVSRTTISRLERGLIDGLTIRSLRAISRGLEMPSLLTLGWRAPEIDLLRDRMHAGLVERVTTTLGGLGWETRPEYSFNQFGERGSVDVLAYHPTSGTTHVVEVKTRLWDIQNLLSTIDRKRRLVPAVAARDLGWHADAIGSLLVLPEMSTHRHVVSRHSATFQACLPSRQWDVRDWLSNPSGNRRGIPFLPISRENDIGQGARRLRASKTRPRASRSTESRSNRPIVGR